MLSSFDGAKYSTTDSVATRRQPDNSEHTSPKAGLIAALHFATATALFSALQQREAAGRRANNLHKSLKHMRQTPIVNNYNNHTNAVIITPANPASPAKEYLTKAVVVVMVVCTAGIAALWAMAELVMDAPSSIESFEMMRRRLCSIVLSVLCVLGLVHFQWRVVHYQDCSRRSLSSSSGAVVL